MRMKEFGKLGFKTSLFGLGCMRFPQRRTAAGPQVEAGEAIKMIRYAIDHGVNYLDTGYEYHQGESEVIVGRALRDGYREKTKLATKLPLWRVKTIDDCRRILEEQLRRLQVESIDFYLLHAVNAERWRLVQDLEILAFLEAMVRAGKIKHLGFSFHDELSVFKEVIDAYPWAMAQIQLNIVDAHHQAGVEGLHYAGAKGIPVVIMEPLKGGRLAQTIPQDVLDLWAQAPVKRSPVEWAFRWLCHFPEVTVILSGVSSMAQLKDNIGIFTRMETGGMTGDELALVEKVRDLYLSKTKVPCTGCEYCLPCAREVAIPWIFALYNDIFIFDDRDGAVNRYRELTAQGKDASRCIECGACVAACPQKIPVIESLKAAHRELTGRGV
ncbi:MAG: aldo/keto reductase [Firmicutes bacterium]|nr:aldo/keto reductase [Bacillota bacterium]